VGTLLGSIDSSYLNAKPRVPISFSWTGYQYENYFLNSLIDPLKFKTVHDIFDGVKNKNGGTFGICTADNSGNIGYIPVVRHPKRKDPFSGERGIKPGWTGEYEWDGFDDHSDFPIMINPKKGYLFTANGRISSLNVKAGVGATIPATPRAARIKEMLHDLIHVQKKKVDINDMKKIMKDTKDIFAELKTPLMIKIAEQGNNLEKYTADKSRLPQLREWIKVLKSWDYTFEKEMAEPTLFSLWEVYIFDNMFKRQISNDKLRNFVSRKIGHEDFIVKFYEKLAQDSSYFSKYCQLGNKDVPNACVKAIVEGLNFVHEYLIPAGTTFKNEDAYYGKWHTIEYSYAPFTNSSQAILQVTE